MVPGRKGQYSSDRAQVTLFNAPLSPLRKGNERKNLLTRKGKSFNIPELFQRHSVFLSLDNKGIIFLEVQINAYYQPISKARSRSCEEKELLACPYELPTETGSLREGLYHHTEEAELGPEKGRPRETDERYRSNNVYTWNRTQPAGALSCSYQGRQSEGLAGCSLPYY